MSEIIEDEEIQEEQDFDTEEPNNLEDEEIPEDLN